jgi:hypothetical protein
MLSISQFENENRNELQALFDKLYGYNNSLFDKLTYRNLVIFLYRFNAN